MVLVVIAVVEVLIAAGAIWYLFNQKVGGAIKALSVIQDQIEERKRLKGEIENRLQGMVKVEVLAFSIKQHRELLEKLKTEQGRIAITQTELETVETRLRELEEIERELEASSLELQEELNSLKEKEGQLRSKNDKLKTDIQESIKHIDELMGEIELSAQVIEQVKLMKTQLLATEDKTEKLLVQIEEVNGHYVDLKRRYDALDIEYAQLYEKFSALENAAKASAGA